ncbi:uncharacterized protein LOC113238960 isoform X2 [Hyposmocoma kahamanoa]|uniref:uncharacterized protein LOC113238960 isoform X2 n=1 Tax=Hyposmocoma kahamanoa TaxID=1477025 RepID=UPI000E6D9D43|nr:uncharacterized protein LOC113238960 isoform X2 [Hyposmocoma kahamanoa]
MRAGSIGILGCVLASLAISAGNNAAISNDLSSTVSKQQSPNKDEISRDGISTETSESEVTTSSPEYSRSAAYAVASSDGSGSSQAVAQATATSGGDNTLNPGMGGRYPQYPQYPQPKGLGYDPSQLVNYNPQTLTSGPILHNAQARPNTPGGMNPYSLPLNWNTKYPGAGPNLYPNTGFNFAPQVSNAQAQAFGTSSSAQAQAQANVLQQAYPTTLQQNYPWDNAYNNMSPGYVSVQPQDVPDSPAQTVGQGYYQYGQAYPPQPVLHNPVYTGPVSGFPDYGSAQIQPNALSVRRNTESMQALLNEGPYLTTRRYEPAQNEAKQSYLAYPRSAQNVRSNMRAFGPIYQNVGYNAGSIEAQSDLPIYKNLPIYAPGINVVTQSSSLPENFGYTTSPANAFSRIVPEEEVIYPDEIPGAENSVVCGRIGELHHLWMASYQCLVCVCAEDRGQLRPACARCADCRTPDSLRPESTQTISPLIVETQSSSESPASCNPLPVNKEFQNPLNPCQVCVCQQTSRHDVKITCQESPQCVIPANVPTIPPMPVPSEPVSLPLCNKMPQNVLFPHPTESCKLCKCFVQRSPPEMAEPHVLCQPNPDCLHPDKPSHPSGPYAFPIDEVIPQDPSKPDTLPYAVTGYPTSSEAYPSPESITDHYALSSLTIPSSSPSSLETVPWPPYKRGPLPGPPPHDSCRPFPPNTPFDHPWDECQVCVCSEAAGQNHVSVEVSCYTKPSCCIEIPTIGPAKQVIVPTSIPAAASGNSPQLHILDKMCEFKSFGVEFRSEADRCRICSCELIGAYVAPVCRRAPLPECTNRPASIFNGQVIYIEPRCRHQLPYQPFAVGCNHCTCQSIFNYVVAKCTSNPLCHSANIEGKTSANTQANTQTQFLSYSGGLVSAPLQPTRPMPYSSLQTASGLGAGYANVNSYQKERLYSSNPASAQTGAFSQNNNFYTNGLDGYKGYQSRNEEALAMATASSSGLYQPSMINSYPTENIYSLGNFGNRADLLTQSKNSIFFPNINTYKYTPPNTAHPSVMQVLPTQDVYPSMYSRPGYNPSPPHMGGNWDTFKSNANLNTQSSNAMASASASASASALAGSSGGGGGRGSQCQYEGDMYHQRCQACFCRSHGNGHLYAVCLGDPC